MRSYDLIQRGVTHTQTRSGNTISDSYSFGTTARRTQLNTAANNGNFRTPTAQLFTRSQIKFASGYSRREYVGTSNYSLSEGVIGADPTPYSGLAAGFDNNVYNTALSRLFEQIRGELDLSIDLLQANQAKSMVRKSLRGLVMLGETVRKMKRAPTKEAANLWLEFVYGWKPLASSIYGTAKLFRDGPRQGFFRVTANAVVRKRRTGSISSWVSTNNATYIEENSHRCKIVVNVSVQQSVLNNLASMSSLNPVSIAWELLPYSFVIDWIVDIGGYIRNIESACLYRSAFKSGYYTEGYLITGETISKGSRLTPGQFTDIDSATGSYRYSGKRRTVLGSIPYPRLPRAKIDLGSSRLLSAAALLRQKLSRL